MKDTNSRSQGCPQYRELTVLWFFIRGKLKYFVHMVSSLGREGRRL